MSPSTTFVRYALRSSNVFSYLVNIFNFVVYVTHKHFLKWKDYLAYLVFKVNRKFAASKVFELCLVDPFDMVHLPRRKGSTQPIVLPFLFHFVEQQFHAVFIMKPNKFSDEWSEAYRKENA
jgi:hypothetical protein